MILLLNKIKRIQQLAGIIIKENQDNNKKYYIELVSTNEVKKYQQDKQVEKAMNKLKNLGVDVSDLGTSKSYKNKAKRFFVGTYKDGSIIFAPYTTKNDLFNNPMGTVKVTLFTKEEAEKYKNMINNYDKSIVAFVKTI
jgi:hypothetical protein